MPRYLTRSLQVALDLVALSAALWCGFLFRFETQIPAFWARVGLVNWPYVLAVEYTVLWAFGVPRFSWRYVSLRESWRIAFAVLVATGVLVALRFVVQGHEGPWQITGLPLGVLGSNLFLAFVGLVGVRASRRVYGEVSERRLRDGGRAKKRVLLIGAGQAGVLVARELVARPDLELTPVGFLDDNPLKANTQINGLPVLGTTDRVAEIAARKRVDRVLITIANASGPDIRRITLACHAAGLGTKIIPGIHEIVGDRVNLSRIREVAIEDLLGREPVELDAAIVSSAIGEQVVMVTGAGGSIGSELCRQVCHYAPRRLVLVERFENALFEIHRELAAAFPGVLIEPKIADVTDVARMDQLFIEQRPSFVFHAAAHKHVPMMEANPGEAVKNNVGGTRVVADLSDKYGVSRFVLVSTDKAVNPSSVMGATKRVAEIYTQALGQRSKTRFVTVRFGNVLGSNGSVIPIFKEQIAKGGPVTVTHPEMQRYFMTIPEASQLVLQAGAMGQGGEIFILDMGEPVRIVDLARDLITLSGLRPDDDIAIEFAGVRPGEKLFEELSTDVEHADKTKHPKIFIGRIPADPLPSAVRSIDDLLATEATPDGVRRALLAIVPEYTGAPGMAKPAPAARRTSTDVGDGTGPRPVVAAN
ncbi:MAG TPA: nucleoside-diphosphate sugar epimerase/dehydratase [Acidimicrobiia bacterium]|jgi:FlaA1/EpsC-like NDP-sugar epimerase|nr:nucleoside-diphosphate sugar epimerase/dehydratase [Acidimicrobiia bacterium]